MMHRIRSNSGGIGLRLTAPYRSARSVPSSSLSPNAQHRDSRIFPCYSLWKMAKFLLLVTGLLMILGGLYLPILLENFDKERGLAKDHAPHAIIMKDEMKKGTKKGIRPVLAAVDIAAKLPLEVGIGRGLSGLPPNMTPALKGASRGRISCDVDVDSLAYWNNPQGYLDRDFVSPFLGESGAVDGAVVDQTKATKYIAFGLDQGGWNNIRMTLETIFIIAATTGRTVVIPPDAPLYLLKKSNGFMSFFSLDDDENFSRYVKMITTEEFIKLEGGTDGRFPLPEVNATKIKNAAKGCVKREISEISCFRVYNYFGNAGYIPELKMKNCLVFDENEFHGGTIRNDDLVRVKEFCKDRKIMYYQASEQEKDLIYLRGGGGKKDHDYRLLAHFYGYMFFTNPKIDNHYKRFVRDFLHYRDEIFCTAGKIVRSLNEETIKENSPSGLITAGYSSLHIRRGDLQYKKVKISAEEWYDNLVDTWNDREILYIATDERNKTFFDPMRKEGHVLKFLDDYIDIAGLSDIDPSYFGMIDTIVASQGRSFAGTFRSTFSGYINRMRGYHGMSMKDSYYGMLEVKKIMHDWPNPVGSTFAYEWPAGWIGIDGDVVPSKSTF